MFNLAEQKINGVYGWFSSDPNAKSLDPNAYELTGLFIDANNARLDGKAISEEASSHLNEMWENRRENYLKNNIGTNNLSFRICSDCYDGKLSNTKFSTEATALLQRLAGVSLYLNQEVRNNGFVNYNNIWELQEIENNAKIAMNQGYDLSEYLDGFVIELNELTKKKEERTR